MVRLRATIIGAGIVGASIAYRLSQSPGIDTRVLDSSSPGSGATSASTAWLNASNKRPRDYFDLNFAGLREYHALCSELLPKWVNLTGTLAYGAFTPDFEGRVAQLEEWGYRVEHTDANSAFSRYLPDAQVANTAEYVAHYPDEGWVDTNGATRELVARASANRAEYHQGCAVTRIDKLKSGYLVTLSDGATFSTNIVINAAGPQADRIASMVGRHLPLAPTKGITVKFYAPELKIEKVVLIDQEVSDQLQVRPDVGGCVRTHSDAASGMLAQGAATDRDEIVAVMRERVERFIPSLKSAAVAGVFMGIHPIPADKYSCVGPVKGYEGYFEAVTHSGVTLGPLVGRLITEFIVEGSRNPLLTERFSPDRFTDAL